MAALVLATSRPILDAVKDGGVKKPRVPEPSSIEEDDVDTDSGEGGGNEIPPTGC